MATVLSLWASVGQLVTVWYIARELGASLALTAVVTTMLLTITARVRVALIVSAVGTITRFLGPMKSRASVSQSASAATGAAGVATAPLPLWQLL